MTPRRARRLAWLLWAGFMTLAAATITLLILGRAAPGPEGAFGFRGTGTLMGLPIVTVGAIVAARLPSNPIGWLLCGTGLIFGGYELPQQYAVYTVLADPGVLAGGEVAAWVASWLWISALVMLCLVFLLFPDGHLPSPRWRPAPWVLVLSGFGAQLALALMPGPIDTFRSVRNPFGAEGSRAIVEALDTAANLALILTVGAAAASLFVRFRRARGDERAQLRWIAAGGVLLAVSSIVYYAVFVAFDTGPAVELAELLIEIGFVAIPVAVGIAILKYRLYDIDVVISKAVVFGLLAVFISSVYVGIVIGIGALVGSRGNTILSAVAAALVALAFQPVRRRARGLANRFVYGHRASPYEVLSEFSERVAGAYGAEDVLPRMARILGQGMGADRSEVWLRVGPQIELASSWPDPGGSSTRLPLPAGHLPAFPETATAVPVAHDGELLGALVVTKPATAPLTPAEAKLIGDLAHQAGLVLRNAVLIAEVRASRQRLVAAQDEERRRIERNLHDGAQQQIVALSVKLGLLERVAQREPDRVESLAAELRGEAQDALDTLRDLARGIYPPLLADKGLRAALDSQAQKAPLPVEVEVATARRFPQEVEAAVYFCCLEALQNVAKYAEASRAAVHLREDGGQLLFVVEDDGVGFDSDRTASGTGLQGIQDRLEALGGSLAIRSTPGGGTSLTGRLPIPG